MSLGLGIFLSTLLLCLFLLYRWTAQRWNWRRGFKWTALVTVSLLAVSVAVLFAYRQYENRLVRQTRYYDVALGMTQDDVIYTKGYPPNVYGAPEPLSPGKPELGFMLPVIDADKLEKNKTVKDYGEWSYPDAINSSDRLDIWFSPKTKRVSKITCFSEGYHCRDILGIAGGTTEEEAMERLGHPARKELSGVSKTLEYPSLNISLTLSKKKVYMLSVTDGEDGKNESAKASGTK